MHVLCLMFFADTWPLNFFFLAILNGLHLCGSRQLDNETLPLGWPRQLLCKLHYTYPKFALAQVLVFSSQLPTALSHMMRQRLLFSKFVTFHITEMLILCIKLQICTVM